uniref:RING-type domain-containing protein n=1 Tax=viral metagenome TaxID=1070528 RepID=A0A6C0B4E3_9ZZZZ
MDNRNPFFETTRRNHNRSEEDRILIALNELMIEYNYTVRSTERRFHDNVASYIQIVQSTLNRQRRGSNYPHYNQNNTSVPNNNRYAFYNTPFSDTIYTNIINETVHHAMPGLFQDVLVNATEEQINNATESFNYRAEETIHTRCPITLEDFQENESVCQIRQCGHLFREMAIKNWFRQNVRCPVCRYDIRTDNPTEPGEEETAHTDELPRVSASINRIVQNLSNGLQTVLQNYLDRDTSMNNVFSIEVPLYIYNDLSGNY